MSLRIHNVALTCVDAMRHTVEWRITGTARTDADQVVEYVLMLETCRGGVTQILRQIQAMHVRDADWIKFERERLNAELKILPAEERK